MRIGSICNQLNQLLWGWFLPILLAEPMLDGAGIHGMAMGMLLICTVCFATIIGETHMICECFFCMKCCWSGVTRLELTICISCKQCVSLLVMVKHTWHTWFFFTDMNNGITLMGMTILHDFFFLQNRFIEEYV